MRNPSVRGLLALAAVLVLAEGVFAQSTDPPAPPPEPPPASPPPHYPVGKFSGLVFGDYYSYDRWHQDQISPANPNSVQGQQGFWLRRIYFAYDVSFSEKLTTRLRLEANSNGQFQSPGNLTPFVKDAFLKWIFAGRQAATFGIQPSLTFDWYETWYGLRHIEKTAGQYVHQKRENANAEGADQTIDIWSGFGYWEIAPKRADVFFRLDDVKGRLGGGLATGLPGADGIDYWILSPNQPFRNYIFGGEYHLHPTVRVGPNLELVKYDTAPDPDHFPDREQDRIFRLTLFWSW